jgi:hypothetical protein
MQVEYKMSKAELIFYVIAIIAFTVALFVIVSDLFGLRFVERDIGLDYLPHSALGFSPYCEYDEAYCITGKPDPDLTPREIQYYCMLLDSKDRPSFCFKETLDFTYRMTPQLNEETRILALCINSNLTIPKCEMLYGGLNTSYGEQIK